MGVGIGYAIYLAAFFVMIGLALLRVLPVVFLGGIVIALFIGGLFYFWLDAWRETEKMIETEKKHEEEEQPVPAR
jgi:predicted tellurium resistance membrane protein TerC